MIRVAHDPEQARQTLLERNEALTSPEYAAAVAPTLITARDAGNDSRLTGSCSAATAATTIASTSTHARAGRGGAQKSSARSCGHDRQPLRERCRRANRRERLRGESLAKDHERHRLHEG